VTSYVQEIWPKRKIENNNIIVCWKLCCADFSLLMLRPCQILQKIHYIWRMWHAPTNIFEELAQHRLKDALLHLFCLMLHESWSDFSSNGTSSWYSVVIGSLQLGSFVPVHELHIDFCLLFSTYQLLRLKWKKTICCLLLFSLHILFCNTF